MSKLRARNRFLAGLVILTTTAVAGVFYLGNINFNTAGAQQPQADATSAPAPKPDAGTATPQPAKGNIGDACGSQAECVAAPHLTCLSGKCVIGKDAGEACDDTDECRDALVCLPAGTCGAQLALGDTCSNNTQCEGDLGCIADKCSVACKKNRDCPGLLACEEATCVDPCGALPRRDRDPVEAGCVYASMLSGEMVQTLRARLRGMTHKARAAYGARLEGQHRRDALTHAHWRLGDNADTSLTADGLRRHVLGGRSKGVRTEPMPIEKVLSAMEGNTTMAETIGVAKKAIRRASGGLEDVAAREANDALALAIGKGGPIDQKVENALAAHLKKEAHAEPASVAGAAPPPTIEFPR